MKKRILSVLLCLCMVMALLPTAAALAADGNHTVADHDDPEKFTKLWMDGNTLKKGEDENDVWTPTKTDGKDCLTLETGSYYLESDLTLTDYSILISGNVTLCLNGNDIVCNGETKDGHVISVGAYGTTAHLTLTDCQTTAGTINGGDKASPVVNLYGGCGLDMYGGTITGGIGVYVDAGCTFNMSGGAITDNKGCGVNMAAGTFKMSGGAITGNRNGGVYVHNPGSRYPCLFYVSGAAEITGNTANGKANNVYLLKDKYIIVEEKFTGTIGVTAVDPSGTIVSTTKNEYISGGTFNSDDGKYGIDLDGTTVKLKAHNWKYTSDGSTITANCTECGADGGSVRIVAPTGTLTYNGNAKPAMLTANDWLGADVQNMIKYSKCNRNVYTPIDTVPTDAGDYKASITVGGKTASVEYTINPKTLNDVKIGTIGDQPFNNGNEIKPTVTVTSSQTINSYSLVKDMDYTVSYANNTAVGTANVTVTAKDGSNYTFSPAVTENFNITKAAIPGDVQSAITGYTGTYDGNSHNAVVIGNAANGYTLKYSNAENGTYNAGMPQVTNVSDSTTVWVEISRDNYTPVKKSVTVTVSQAALGGNDALKNIRFNDIEEKTITATDFGLSQAGTFAQNGSVTGDSSVLASATYSSNIKVQLTGGLSLSSPAQTVTIPVTFTPSNTNYTAKDYTLTITLTAKQDQAALTLIPSATTVTYDQTLTLDTTGGTTNGEVTYSVTNGTGTATIAGNVLTATRAGTVTVTATMAGNDAYSDVTSAPVTITINPKQITPPAADATVFTYNGNEQTYTLTENAAYTITGNKQTVANESGYTVTVALNDTVNTKWAGDGDDIANKTYTFIIKKATITVTVNNQSIYVNDAAPDLSSPVLGTHYTVTGLVGEDILGGTIAMKYQKDSVDTVPNVATPGSYDIVLSGAEAPTDGNYNDIVYVSGTLTISARPVAPSGGGSYTPPTYKVESEVTEDTDGSVSFSKSNAKKGDTVTITVTPDRYYKVAGVTVKDKNGKEIAVTDNGDGTFTFKMPDSKVAVEPVFSWDNPFTDVAEDTYYAPAVEWALKNNVTNGTGDGTTFSPDASCTRAQIVTFLWKAAGCPEPASTNSFTDVSADAYYAKAVAWAAEQGITSGTGDGTTFSPDMECSRGQMAAFLCRMADGQPVSGSIAFTDVPADAYYAESVQWAVENSITEGTGAGKYSPDAVCTRGQMVTFLYRWLVK